MRRRPDISILRGLLFTYDIDNTKNPEREKLITSKNVNDNKELSDLFDALTMEEFLSYEKAGQDWFIQTLNHYLEKGDNFDYVFSRMTAYFDDDVTDQRQFMRVLRDCLTRYQTEASEKNNED